LTEYQAYIKKDVKPKKVPMQPGVLLTNDCLEIPDPLEQRIYRSFLAKAQFVAQWIRYDTSNTTSQSAHFVHQQEVLIGQHSITQWDICDLHQASN
jgi:hypothetical protein